MATEDLTGSDKFVDDLVAANPVATDSVSDGDEHIRGVKNVLKNTLPNVTAAVTATAAQLNKTASTFTGADGSSAGASGMVTAPVATDNTKFLKGDGTWATPAGGGGGSGGTITAVASGAIANGDKVILKSDGKVATVSEAVTATEVDTPITAGSEVTFESYNTWDTAVAYNPNLADQVVVAYRDRSNSSYGTVRLGTITGTTPAFESEVVFNTAQTEWTQIAFDPNTTGKFVVVYEDAGDLNKLKAVVGTITNTTVTFGSEYTLDSTGAISWTSCEFDPNTAGKFLVAYEDEGTSNYGRVLVSTINYTTGVITPGSPYTFKSAYTNYIDVAFDPNTAGKFVVGYAASSNGYTIVGTITTGTTVTFGSEVSFYSTAAPWDVGVDFDPDTAGRFMVIYRASGINPTVHIGTVTGTVPSYGSANNVWVGTADGLVAKFIENNEIIFVYTDGQASPSGQCLANLGTVSGTTVTMGTPQQVNAVSTSKLDIATDPNTAGKFITSYRDGGDSSYGKTAVGQLTVSTSTSPNLTADNFIGISDAAYADAATATIQVIGSTDDAQSGMTIGSNYYVQTDGTLATTAGSTSAFVGVALSATEILIGGATTLAELTGSTTATTDPLITSNLAVGHFWINSTSGEAFVCTDATTNENFWTNIGDGLGAIQAAPPVVDYLVVAGGGGGAKSYNSTGSGGGGAGGLLTGSSSFLLDSTTYSVIIGAGGSGASSVNTTGGSGSNSTYSSIVTTGGGGGGAQSQPTANATSGGSGGGGESFNTSGGASGTAGQGHAGGDGVTSGYSPAYGAGGGGGAGSVGADGSTSSGGNGGDGVSSSITGTALYYAGGGGGGATGGSGGSGGSGVGGYGGNSTSNSGTHGDINTGSGGGSSGGGGGSGSAGNGGSGVVILKIPDRYTATFSSGVTYSTVTSVSGFTIHVITASSSTSETVTYT